MGYPINSAVKRDIIVIVLFVLAAFLPFIGKPFNVDEPLYIAQARQLQTHPLHPYSFSINWSGHVRDVWSHSEITAPPIVPLFIAFLLKIFGAREIPLHLVFLIFPMIAAISMYFLARRFTANALIASLIMIAAPAFLVSATGIMLDVPFMAAILLAMELFARGLDGDSTIFLAVGSCSAGLAALMKYSTLIMFPVMALFALYRGKPLRALWLIAGAAIFLAWCAHNLFVYGSIHLIKASGVVASGLSLHKLIAFPPFFTGCMVFPLALIFCCGKIELSIAAISGFAGALFGQLYLGGGINAALYGVFSAGLALFIAILILRQLWKEWFLVAWLALSIFIAVYTLPWLAARYFLLALPPAVLLFVKAAESAPLRTKKTLSFALAITLITSICVAKADLIWAQAYRQGAQYISLKGYRPGVFAGHFGFQWYAEKAGLTPLNVDEPMPEGFLVVARFADAQIVGNEDAKRLTLLEAKDMQSSFPFRVMAPAARAGFYSSFWGVLPYSISHTAVETFLYYRVSPKKG